MPKILGSRKRRFEVINNKPDVSFKGVEVGGEQFNFGRSGGFMIDDPGKAKAINEKYGQEGPRDVIVIDTDDVPAESGHRYFFSFSGLPWKKYDERGRVIPDEE